MLVPQFVESSSRQRMALGKSPSALQMLSKSCPIWGSASTLLQILGYSLDFLNLLIVDEFAPNPRADKFPQKPLVTAQVSAAAPSDFQTSCIVNFVN